MDSNYKPALALSSVVSIIVRNLKITRCMIITPNSIIRDAIVEKYTMKDNWFLLFLQIDRYIVYI